MLCSLQKTRGVHLWLNDLKMVGSEGCLSNRLPRKAVVTWRIWKIPVTKITVSAQCPMVAANDRLQDRSLPLLLTNEPGHVVYRWTNIVVERACWFPFLRGMKTRSLRILKEANRGTTNIWIVPH